MGALMIQGTGSNIGKSLLVAGLCRAFSHRGLRVAPFKPQNMSNNAAVTADGGEIGRAQALQALACGLAPVADMNPVLLKPESDTGSQIIVQGKVFAHAEAGGYAALKPRLLGAVRESFGRLAAGHDLVIVEGAGSPAEINLRRNDIANMGFARAENVPVILAGDIDRGGVIAQMVGTKVILDPEDEALIKGFIINKFRGDPALFKAGYEDIALRTGWQGMGVLPWFADAHLLPAEDALDFARPLRSEGLHIVCLGLSRIANFDDLDPLAASGAVRLTMLAAGKAIPGDADLVIIPGTKSTRGDLAFLRRQGWDIDLVAHHRRGGHILGICGGYQMLGRRISDPSGIEGEAGDSEGLGLLDVVTEMGPAKTVAQVSGRAMGQTIRGYEIHIGRSTGPDTARPFAMLAGRPEGAVSPDGRIIGTYLHGMFSENAFRAAFLAGLGAPADNLDYDLQVGQVLDRLCKHVEAHLDLDAMLEVARNHG